MECIVSLTLRETSRASGQGASSSTLPPKQMTLHEFLKYHTPEFHGEDMGEFADKDTWVVSIESLFKTTRCRLEDRVAFAAFQMKEATKWWWENLVAANEHLVDTLSWEDFKKSFTDRFIPKEVMKYKEHQFDNLT